MLTKQKSQHEGCLDTTPADRPELMTEPPKSSPRVRRTSKTLIDGRELVYFDDSEPYLSGARSREAVDERPLDVRPTAATMRLDALTGEWVSIADHRQDRTFLPPADECPSVRRAAPPWPRRSPPTSMTLSSSRSPAPSLTSRSRQHRPTVPWVPG